MNCVTYGTPEVIMSSGGKASQILCSKVEVVPLFLDLTFVSGNIPL